MRADTPSGASAAYYHELTSLLQPAVCRWFAVKLILIHVQFFTDHILQSYSRFFQFGSVYFVWCFCVFKKKTMFAWRCRRELRISDTVTLKLQNKCFICYFFKCQFSYKLMFIYACFSTYILPISLSTVLTLSKLEQGIVQFLCHFE
jgi:hypothetical protein